MGKKKNTRKALYIASLHLTSSCLMPYVYHPVLMALESSMSSFQIKTVCCEFVRFNPFSSICQHFLPNDILFPFEESLLHPNFLILLGK